MPLLVDGHNVIGRSHEIALEDPNDEAKLVMQLRRYAARTRKKITVVFDRGLPGGASHWSTPSVEVRFAAAPKRADDVIIARLRREVNPRGLTVVTSDEAVARAAREHGAKVKDAAVFARELAELPASQSLKQRPLSKEEVEFWEQEFKRGRQE